jgi:hypothetical protein
LENPCCATRLTETVLVLACDTLCVLRLEFFGNDIHGLNLGVSNEQFVSLREERLGKLPVDVRISSGFILKRIEYPERRRADPEGEPRCLVPVSASTSRPAERRNSSTSASLPGRACNVASIPTWFTRFLLSGLCE